MPQAPTVDAIKVLLLITASILIQEKQNVLDRPTGSNLTILVKATAQSLNFSFSVKSLCSLCLCGDPWND